MLSSGAGLSIGDSVGAVRAALGQPVAQTRGPELNRLERFRSGVRVSFDRRSHRAVHIDVASSRVSVRGGAVGATEMQLRSRVRGLRCGLVRAGRLCGVWLRRRRATPVTMVAFVIEAGRVARISVDDMTGWP